MKYQIDNLLRRVLGVAITVIVMLALSENAQAEDKSITQENSTLGCMLRIEGVIYDATPCNLNSEDDDIIRFGHLTLEDHQGYWVYLIEREDGRYDGFWNEDFGANHAHTSLGVLSREDREGVDCFSNQNTLLCRNIPFDTPVYDVEFRSLEEGGHAILAYLNGIEYEVQHPNWDVMQPYSVEQSADLDGDGHLETLIEVSHGGNCCPSDVSILSYRGDGFFTYLDKTPISGGWGGAKILTQAEKPIIRVHDVPAGHGNIAAHRGERDYAVVNGNLKLIAERTEFGIPSGVAELTLEEVQSSDGQMKDLVFDIDQDGQKDVVSCSYWERWGVLNCTAQISGVSESVELQCRHLAVSNAVFGVRKSHRLLCDGENMEY